MDKNKECIQNEKKLLMKVPYNLKLLFSLARKNVPAQETSNFRLTNKI